MKKSLIVLLSVSVVMLFAASSFALHAVPENYEYTPSLLKAKSAMIEMGGNLRVRGEINDNYSDFNDDGESDNTRAFYDSRARVHMKATVSPNTMGMIEFELNESTTDDSWDLGECGDSSSAEGGAKGIYGKGNCKPTGVTVRQAYIAHQGKGLGMLSGFKVGHMLIGLGNGLFYNHTQYGDDAIVLWFSPADGMEISLNALKLQEQGAASSDDTDAYVATYAGSFAGANVSADVTFLNDNDRRGGDTPQGIDLWNFGLRGDMTVGPAKVKADVEVQTGKVKEAGGAGNDDYDLGGYAFLLGATFDAGPVTLMIEGAYGSGDSDPNDDEYEGFITSLSDGEDYTYLYDQKAKTAAQNLDGSYVFPTSTNPLAKGTSRTGLNNTWYIGVGASGKATPDMKWSGDVYYLQASESVSDAKDFDSKDIGVEVDGKLEYQIDKNLVWYVEAGYLFAGDFYANITGDKDNIDDAYSVRNGVVIQF